MRVTRWAQVLAVMTLTCGIILAQDSAKSLAAGQVIPVVASTARAEALLEGDVTGWNQAPAKLLSLNRTPPLYDTDEPADSEIPVLEVSSIRAADKLYVHLAWNDSTRDAVALPTAPDSPPETRFLKVQTAAEDRFFDAAAVMLPAQSSGDLSPSLQMGDASHPVRIY